MFVFDTSALIDAWVRKYPPDVPVFTPIWAHFEGMARAGDLLLPQEVLVELKDKDDDLYAWTKEREDLMVHPTTGAMMQTAREVLEQYPTLTKTGKGRGLADPWVIALARDIDCTVVTGEEGGTQHKPKIPFVCGELGIDCTTLLDVIRDQNITLP